MTMSFLAPFPRLLSDRSDEKLYDLLGMCVEPSQVCVYACLCVHQIIEMIKEIQEVFINNLEQLTWMDRQTKEAAKQKVVATKPVNEVCAIVFSLRIIEENNCIFPPFAFLRPKPSGNKSATMTKFWMMNTSTASTVMYEGFSSSTLLTGSTEAVTKKQVICCCFFFKSF